MMASARWVLIRLGSALVTLFGVSVIVFVAIHRVPGGYEQILLGPFATPELRQVVAEKYGLDASLIEQYLRWFREAATGDLGTSLASKQPVLDEFRRRAPVTIELTVLATLISLVAGTSLGMASALTADRRRLAGGSRLLSGLGLSVPDFVVGSLARVRLLGELAVLHRRRLRPVLGGPDRQHPGDGLPAITLGVFGHGARRPDDRDAVLGVMTEPFITAAVARGDRPRRIVSRHVLRNSSPQVVTVTATYVGLSAQRSGDRRADCSPSPGSGSTCSLPCPTATTQWSRPGS